MVGYVQYSQSLKKNKLVYTLQNASTSQQNGTYI